jgi:hypothetical protein
MNARARLSSAGRYVSARLLTIPYVALYLVLKLIALNARLCTIAGERVDAGIQALGSAIWRRLPESQRAAALAAATPRERAALARRSAAPPPARERRRQ